MKVILVPQWLARALEYAKKDLSVVEDLKELTTILSPEDVAKYLYLNTRADVFMSPGFVQTFNKVGQQDIFNCGLSDDYAGRVSNICGYMLVKQPISTREAWLGATKVEGPAFSLTSRLVRDNLIVITPILGQSDVDAVADTAAFMDQFVGQWVSVLSLDKVANTPFFKEYLNILN